MQKKKLNEIESYLLAGIIFSKTIKHVTLVGLNTVNIKEYLCSNFSHLQLKGFKTKSDKRPVDDGASAEYQMVDLYHNDYINKINDLIMYDIQVKQPIFYSIEHLMHIYESLSSQGVLIICYDFINQQQLINDLMNVRQIFHSNTLCYQIGRQNTLVIVAIKNPDKENLTETTNKNIQNWNSSFSIDLQSIYEEIKVDNPIGSGIF